MITSCGVLFIRNGKILLGHATGQPHWDIPKGKMENGEGYLDAAIREVHEEIGFVINPVDLDFMDETSYRRGKRLALFLYIGKYMPVVEYCECTSYFTTKTGKELPEMDDFKYVKYSELEGYVTQRMLTSIMNVVGDQLV